MEETAAAVINRFTTALDSLAFEDAVGLLTDDASYRVVLRKNYERGGILGLINDTKGSFKLRCTMQHPAPPKETVHLVSNIQAKPEGNDALKASANFSVSRGGVPTFDGEYRLEMRNENGDWRLTDVLVLLDGDIVPAHIMTPI